MQRFSPLGTNLQERIEPSHGPVPWKFLETVLFEKVVICCNKRLADFLFFTRQTNIQTFLRFFFAHKHVFEKIMASQKILPQ